VKEAQIKSVKLNDRNNKSKNIMEEERAIFSLSLANILLIVNLISKYRLKNPSLL